MPFFSNKWFTVESSCLSYISYDYDRSLLKIRFKTSGQAYQYIQMFPPKFFNNLSTQTRSVVSRSDHIKDRYPTQLLLDY